MSFHLLHYINLVTLVTLNSSSSYSDLPLTNILQLYDFLLVRGPVLLTQINSNNCKQFNLKVAKQTKQV